MFAFGIEKAFDKVWHAGLLETIKQHFPDSIHQLLKSYLSNRTFYVKVNDAYSDIQEINAGVPQGSVLGPILYTLYTVDIPTTSSSTTCTFANDTNILVRLPESSKNIITPHSIIRKMARRTKNKGKP